MNATMYGNATDSIFRRFENKSTPTRIIELNQHFGNNALLRDDSIAVVNLLNMLEIAFKDDVGFYRYIQYFQNTQLGIYEQSQQVKIAFFKEKLKEYKKKKQPIFHAMLLHNIGMYSFVEEDYNQAFEYMMKANELFKEVGYSQVPHIGLYLHDFALSNYTFKYYDLSKELMLSSIELPAYSQNLDVQRFNTLAASYRNMEQRDSALYYWRIAMEKAVQYDMPIWIGLVNENIAKVYADLQQWDSSLYYYQKSHEQLLLDSMNDDIRMNVVFSMIKVLLKIGAIEDAEKMLLPILAKEIKMENGSLFFAKTQILEGSKLNYYETLKEYYAAKNEYKLSNNYADSLYALKTRINNKYETKVIKLTEYKLQLAKKQLELYGFKSQRNTNILILILLGAALFIAILAIWTMRLKKRKNEALYLLETKEMSFEIEKKQLELKVAKEELLGYIHNLTSQNEFIETISKELEFHKSNSQNENTTTDSQIEMLKQQTILTEDDWDNFQEMYCKFNAALYHQLRNYQPSLTNGELRYLLLVSLQLSKKEIANMLGISPDSLRVTWNRLKKKLPIEFDSNPESFLQAIQNNDQEISRKELI